MIYILNIFKCRYLCTLVHNNNIKISNIKCKQKRVYKIYIIY